VASSTAATRNLTIPSAEVIAAGFRLPRPLPGKSSPAAIAAVAPDHFALVETTKVVDGDTSTLDPAERDGLRKQFAEQGRGGLEARAYTEALKREFPVKVAEDRL
jgi:hypothetical protein